MEAGHPHAIAQITWNAQMRKIARGDASYLRLPNLRLLGSIIANNNKKIPKIPEGSQYP